MTTTLPDSGTGTSTRPTWRDERRKNHAHAAELNELHAAARQRRQFAAAEHARQLKAAARADKRQARKEAREDRAELLADLGTWVTGRLEHLTLLPVILVPAILAMSAQASWGHQQFGPVGVILFLATEGSPWYFAIKAQLARTENPDAPVWHLRLGTWVFAGIGAAINFVHGYDHGGWTSGLTMALVSLSGIIAHQLANAGPRRSRQQRRADRLARRQARLEARVMRAAIDEGTVVIAADGSSRVSVRPGAVTLRRTWRGTRLEPARDVQAEIDDVTEAAITIVDHARAERDAAQAEIGRARSQAEAAAAEGAQAVEAAQEERDAALAELDRVRELARGLRDAGETANARAAAAEQQLQQSASAGQAAIEAAQRETAAQLDSIRAELRAAQAAARDSAEKAAAAQRDLIIERNKVERLEAAARNANGRADNLARQLDQMQAQKQKPHETKKEALIRLYKAHENHGDRACAARTANELAAVIDLSPGAARNYVNEYLRDLDAETEEKGAA